MPITGGVTGREFSPEQLARLRERQLVKLRSRPKLSDLSAKLDGVIEFDYKTKYPRGALESVWRKLKQPPVKLAPKMDKDKAKLLSLARRKLRGFSQKLDDLIEFEIKGWKLRGKGTGYLKKLAFPPRKVRAVLPEAEKLSRRNESLLVNSWPLEARKTILQSAKEQSRGIGSLEDERGNVLSRTALGRKGRIKQIYQLPITPKKFSRMLDDLIEFADPRPRNPLGEFQQQGEGGPDANAMATVYKNPQTQPQGHAGPGIPKLAGAALVGGALGQVGGNIGKEGWAGMAKLVKRLAGKTPR